jgi:hypothetical protein
VHSCLEPARPLHLLVDLTEPVQDDEDDLTSGGQVGGTCRAPCARTFQFGRSIDIAAEDGDLSSRRSGLQKPARDRGGTHSGAENAEHAGESSPAHPADLHVKSH